MIEIYLKRSLTVFMFQCAASFVLWRPKTVLFNIKWLSIYSCTGSHQRKNKTRKKNIKMKKTFYGEPQTFDLKLFFMKMHSYI